MSAIKLPVRYEPHGKVVDANGVNVCIVCIPCVEVAVTSEETAVTLATKGAVIVERINSAPALAALEAVAREASNIHQGDDLYTHMMLREKAKAALALAGATLDGRDATP